MALNRVGLALVMIFTGISVICITSCLRKGVDSVLVSCAWGGLTSTDLWWTLLTSDLSLETKAPRGLWGTPSCISSSRVQTGTAMRRYSFQMLAALYGPFCLCWAFAEILGWRQTSQCSAIIKWNLPLGYLNLTLIKISMHYGLNNRYNKLVICICTYINIYLPTAYLGQDDRGPELRPWYTQNNTPIHHRMRIYTLRNHEVLTHQTACLWTVRGNTHDSSMQTLHAHTGCDATLFLHHRVAHI